MTAADQAMIDRVLEREGGYVDNPLDKGGPTNKGITLKTLTDYLGHEPSLAELRSLTASMAREIYFDMYMLKPGYINIAFNDIREIVFDAAVNNGPRNATKMLQKALGLPADGVFGPRTMQAANSTVGVKQKLLAQRLRFYTNIVHVNPSQAVFLPGWINRIAGLMEEL